MIPTTEPPRPSTAAIAAARARLDGRESNRRIVTPPEAITWRMSDRSYRCWRCRSKTSLRIYRVGQIRRPARTYGAGMPYERHVPAQRWSIVSAECIDEDACRARSSAAYEARQKRSGNLRWAQSRFESPNLDLPKGTCRWCGEPIVFVDGTDYRLKARQRHRGDEWEVGDRNCRREHNRTFAATPRDLIQHRGDPCCVDCGDRGERFVPNEDGEGGTWIQTGEWEADHVVPIADGGSHDPTNIARRCVECHARKTARENAARRQRRRGTA